MSAALLETGGDALVRRGLQGRLWLILAGGAALVAYGVLVNQSGFDFGRLMGAYIVVFFILSQVIAILFFHHAPPVRTLFGGTLILAGGIAILS